MKPDSGMCMCKVNTVLMGIGFGWWEGGASLQESLNIVYSFCFLLLPLLVLVHSGILPHQGMNVLREEASASTVC